MQEIKEVLDIPSYYHHLIEEISSENMHQLLKSNPLDFMRDLFTNDNKRFYNLRDELILRGIGFQKKYQNNYLLGRNYEIQNVIVKSENTDGFKKINFSMIGASNFIERFQITSDLFFHNVPWEGLLSLFPSTAHEYLRKAFEKEGFSVVSIEGYQAIPLTNKQSQDNSVIKETEYRKDDYLYDYSQLELPIEHYYQGNIFQHFLKYCQKNNIQTFSDLNLDKIEDYAKQKFTRQKTINLITKIYHDMNKKYNPLPYDFEEALVLYQNNRFKELCEIVEANYLEHINKFYESENPYEDTYRQEDIEHFVHYVNDNVETIVQEKQQKKKQAKFNEVVQQINEHEKFKYVLSMPIQELIEVFSIKQESIPADELYVYDMLENIDYLPVLEKLLLEMNSMVDLSEMIASITENLKEREKEIVLLRDTLTLQEVGDKIGVTRERVRQVEAASYQRILYYRKRSRIEVYFYYYSEHSKLVDLEAFCQHFNIEEPLEKVIVKQFLLHSKTIHYLESMDQFIRKSDYNAIRSVLNRVNLNHPILEVKELRELIPKDVMDELQEVLDLIIKAQGYLRVNDLYVREKISIKDRIHYLFDHIIEEPLHMDDAGYEFFKELMVTTFGVPYDSTRRSAATRIADGENTILVDSNTYFKHEEGNITDSLLSKLEEIIDETLSVRPYADPRIIYKEYPELMESASLYSPVHLYSIVQLYLGDKYDTGHRNTLYIYPSNAESIDAESILLRYLEKHGHEVPYDQVLVDLKWKAPKLDQLLARITSVITVKEKHLRSIESFEFSETELQTIRDITNQQLEKGYIFTEDLAFDLTFNENLESLVQRAGLTDVTTLSSLIKWLHHDVAGQHKFLYKVNGPVQSIEQAIAVEFPEKISRAELIEFTRTKGYSEQKVASVPTKIVEEELFYPYTSTQFINAKQIEFHKEVKESLRQYLASQFTDSPYRSVFSMIGYSQELVPISQSEWTEWLIHHFAEQVGYRKVISHYSDYRYDKLLLVKEDSDIRTLDELVYYIAKNEYQGREHEEDLAKYLASNNIIYNPRRLSHEIYQSDYFQFDSFGFYQLR